jgi:DNA (cytosine-5)-methyltransferase 1
MDTQIGGKVPIVNDKNFAFADLFAGVGGMRIAFESAGGKCVLTSEINEAALATYHLNFPKSEDHVLVKDVLHLSARDFPLSNDELSVLVAGFPCQPYSIAGLRKGLTDDRGGEIFSALLKILRTVKPKSFLLENVKGIKSHENGETFKYMLDSLSRQGYYLRHETLNSMKHANIPQNRERVFIVGFRDKVASEKFEFPPLKELTKTIHDCLERNEVDTRYYYKGRYGASEQIDSEVTKIDTIYQWRRHYVRENKSKACPTLTANMGSGGHNVPLVRDSKGVRKLTPRETANFQGFPKNFKFPEIADSHLYHQFGNSVTVPLIKLIAKSITKALEL